MRGGQRLGIVGVRRDGECVLGVLPAGVRVAAQPVRRRAPREEERDVPWLALDSGPAVRGERLVEPPDQMPEEAHPPRQPRRQRVGISRGPLEAAQCLVPVAADLERLACELLDRRRPERPRDERDRLEDGVDGPACQQRGALGRQDAGELGHLACGGEAAQRVLRLVVRLEPSRSLASHTSRLPVTRVTARQRELAHGRPERVPPGRLAVALQLDEEPSSRERLQDLRRVHDAERLAEPCGEPLERRDGPHQRLDLGRLPGEHLGCEVGDQRPSRPADALERGPPAGGRHAAQRLHGEPDSGRPAAGRPVQLQRGRRVAGARRASSSSACDLVDVEGQVGARELEHVALSAKPLDREGELGPRGEHEVELRRSLPAERLDHLDRTRRGHLVHVVDDEHEVARELRLQCLADGCGEAPRTGGLVLLGARARRGRDRTRTRPRGVPARGA